MKTSHSTSATDRPDPSTYVGPVLIPMYRRASIPIGISLISWLYIGSLKITFHWLAHRNRICGTTFGSYEETMTTIWTVSIKDWENGSSIIYGSQSICIWWSDQIWGGMANSPRVESRVNGHNRDSTPYHVGSFSKWTSVLTNSFH